MNIVKQKLYETQLSSQGKALQNLANLKDWQWLNEQDLKSLQERRLSALLLHAYKNVPYYRRQLKAAAACDGTRVDLKRFRHLRLLDKETIRARFEELHSADLHQRQWYVNTSGGSTGDPVRFVQDKEYDDWTCALKLLDDSWSGREIGDRQIRLWGSERDLFLGGESMKTQVGRWIKNEKHLNAFRMTEQEMRDYLKIMNSYKPKQVLAYAESIYQLARFAEKQGLAVHRPRAVMTSAGTLFKPMREQIERTFGCPVFDRYGSREVGDIACECESHQGLHVSAPTHDVEILRPDGQPASPGEVGEIVVTLLTNYAMPIIRYRIGDMGAWSEKRCDCGRSYPLIGQLAGRVTDTFVTRDGGQVHGEYFTHLFYYQSWLKKFQVVQEDYSRIRVYLIPEEAGEGAITERHGEALTDIRDKIAFVMGQGCEVIFEAVDDIPASQSGKFRYTMSLVSQTEPDSKRGAL